VSAVEALAMLKLQRPDALVTSLSMPKGGYWLIRDRRRSASQPLMHADAPGVRLCASAC
jgi:hypothetical protein